MDEWTEIRRKVLVEKVSKRSIRRDYNMGSGALEKILEYVREVLTRFAAVDGDRRRVT
jgi:hypothetical protein